MEIYRPKTFLQIYDSMQRYLVGESSSLNNFNVGSRLNTLMEAISLVLSKTHNDFYQGLKTAIPTSVYNAFDFEKKAGTNSIGSLEFNCALPAASTYPIIIGTAIMIDGIKFETTESGEIITGAITSGNIAAKCSQIGVDGNIDISAIDTLTGLGSFVNQPEGIESCKNNLAFAGGTDEESDEDRISRFRNYVNALARSIPNGIKSAILNISGIESATVLESYPRAGWITCYADDGTGSLTAAKKLEIENTINGIVDDEDYWGYRAAGIHVVISAPTIITVNITVIVKILSSAKSTPADVVLEAATAIQTYINTLKLGQDIILSEMNKKIKLAHKDIYDVSITLPASNYTINSDSIARTGTVTVSYAFLTNE